MGVGDALQPVTTALREVSSKGVLEFCRAYDLSIRIDVVSVDHRNSVTGEVWAQSFGFQTSRTPVNAI